MVSCIIYSVVNVFVKAGKLNSRLCFTFQIIYLIK